MRYGIMVLFDMMKYGILFAVLLFATERGMGAPRESVTAYQAVDLGTLGTADRLPAGSEKGQPEILQGKIVPIPGPSLNPMILGDRSCVPIGINACGQVVGEADSPNFRKRAFLYRDGKMLDLGTLGGSSSMAFHINDHGQVVGMADAADGKHHAFVYVAEKMTDLGTLGGPESVALAINANGQVIGHSDTAGTEHQHVFSRQLGETTLSFELTTQQHAFLYTDGKMLDLGTLPGGTLSVPCGINVHGQVVGVGNTGDGFSRAFLFSDGKMKDLGTLGGQDSFALDINNQGQVTGEADTNGGAKHAFLYSNGKMADLGTFGGAWSRGMFINDAGQVAGAAEDADGQTRAFLFSDGKMTDIGTLPGCSDSSPTGLNAAGKMVGEADRPGEINSRCFLYSNGKLTDLSSLTRLPPGWTMTSVAGINDGGQIIVEGESTSGVSHAFLLTPEKGQCKKADRH